MKHYYHVYITTLAPRPFRLKRDMPVLVAANGAKCYRLSECQEAVGYDEGRFNGLDELKTRLCSLYEMYASQPVVYSKEFAVLQSFMEPIE